MTAPYASKTPAAPGSQPAFPPPGPLEPGDALPVFPLARLTGEAVELSHQAIAGAPIVLILAGCDDPATQAELARYKVLLPAFAKAGARLALLGDPATITALSGGLDPAILPAIDGDQGYRMAVGLTAATLAAGPISLLVGPSFRVVAVARGVEQASAILASLKALEEAEQAFPAARQAPVMVVPDIFPPAFCAHLMEVWRVGEQYDDAVSNDGYSGAVAAMKRRRDVGITDPNLQRVVQAYLGRRLMPEIRRSFNFEVTQAEVYRIGCYDGGGENYFKRHRDTGMAVSAHRRYALSLNLNDGYRGGEVIFPEYGQARFRAPAGGAVVFSCALLHEVRPVEEGRRFAMFTFFRGRGL